MRSRSGPNGVAATSACARRSAQNAKTTVSEPIRSMRTLFPFSVENVTVTIPVNPMVNRANLSIRPLRNGRATGKRLVD